MTLSSTRIEYTVLGTAAADLNSDALPLWIWTYCAPVAAVTTWYISNQNDFYHPLHLHLLHCIFSMICLLLTRRRQLFGLSLQHHQNLRQNSSSYALFIIAAFSLAWGLPLFVKAVTYSQNLIPLILTNISVYLIQDLYVSVRGATPSRLPYLRVTIVALACLIAVYDDYRLSIKSLKFLSHSLVLIGIGSTISCFASTQDTSRTAHWDAVITLALPLSIIMTVVWNSTRRDATMGFTDLGLVNPILLFLNVTCSAAAILSGGAIATCARPDPSLDETDEGRPAPDRETRVPRVGASAIVALACVFLVQPSSITWLQYLAYAAGVVALLHLYDTTNSGHHNVLTALKSLVNKDARMRNAILGGITVSGWIAIAVFLRVRFPLMLPDIQSPDILDWQYNPTHNFDVVVSLYDEPLSIIHDTFTAISSIPSIAPLKPRLIVYTKHPSADLDAIRAATAATTVLSLPNIGREAQTYLHHILTRWDSLARQTLFIQAGMHFVPDSLARLGFFYGPDTGMLSLAEPGVTCACAHCNDEQWLEGNRTIARVFSAVNAGRSCLDGDNNSRVLESYRGQFVVSAARIRGPGKSVYETLNRELVDEDSWAHKRPFTDVVASWYRSEDTMATPLFGYTLEKIWNVLFQCSEGRVAWRCPSVDSGLTRYTEREDCQCLDRRAGGDEAVGEGRG